MNQFGDAYKKLEALGDRERVLAVWPDAHVSIRTTPKHGKQWRVWYRVNRPLSDWFATEAEAWHDAASRLPVVAEPAKGEDWAADDDAHMDGHARMILGAEPAAGAQPCDGDHPEPNCGAKDCWHNDPLQPAGSGEIELDLKAVNELSQLDKVTLAVRLFRAEAALRSKQGERNE
jgi:hypothetical protein